MSFRPPSFPGFLSLAPCSSLKAVLFSQSSPAAAVQTTESRGFLLEQTWPVFTPQLCNKIVFLVSFVGNRGTFTRGYRAVVMDMAFLYHVAYVLVCMLGLCVHEFFYSFLVSVCCCGEQNLHKQKIPSPRQLSSTSPWQANQHRVFSAGCCTPAPWKLLFSLEHHQPDSL